MIRGMKCVRTRCYPLHSSSLNRLPYTAPRCIGTVHNAPRVIGTADTAARDNGKALSPPVVIETAQSAPGGTVPYIHLQNPASALGPALFHFKAMAVRTPTQP